MIFHQQRFMIFMGPDAGCCEEMGKVPLLDVERGAMTLNQSGLYVIIINFSFFFEFLF